MSRAEDPAPQINLTYWYIRCQCLLSRWEGRSFESTSCYMNLGGLCLGGCLLPACSSSYFGEVNGYGADVPLGSILRSHRLSANVNALHVEIGHETVSKDLCHVDGGADGSSSRLHVNLAGASVKDGQTGQDVVHDGFATYVDGVFSGHVLDPLGMLEGGGQVGGADKFFVVFTCMERLKYAEMGLA